MIRCIKSSRTALTIGGTPQALVLGSVLFNSFVNYLDNGAACTLSKPANIKNKRAVNTPDGYTVFQGYLDILEKWAKMNVIKFYREKQSTARGEEHPACTSIYWDLLICKSALQKRTTVLG